MRIDIAARFKPFSHCPGTYVLLPGSTLRLQIFPTRLHVDDLAGPLPVSLATIDFDLTGPVDEFSIQQDLERGNVRVWGKTSSGFVRYTIHFLIQPNSGIKLFVEKAASQGIQWKCQGVWQGYGPKILQPKDSLRVALVCTMDRKTIIKFRLSIACRWGHIKSRIGS